MNLRVRLLGLGLAALLLFPPALAAQPPAAREPEEYDDEEFSRGLRNLRRGEIILLGSLPFTLFFTMEVYDTWRFFAHDRQPEYSPWPLRKPGAAPYTRTESFGVIVSALSVSLLVAVADYLLGRAHERREARSSAPD